MNTRNIKLFLLVFFFIPLSAYAVDASLSNKPIVENLPAEQQTSAAETKEEGMMGNLKGSISSFKANDGYLDLGLRTGYIYGYTSFDFNHHTSELEYPFRSYMGGANLSLGYKGFSMNSEFWVPISGDPTAGWHMKDKDWDANGQLESDTRSYTDMNAIIWDANLRYDIFKHSFGQKKTDEENKKPNNMKLGVLIGYRYQRFGFKGYGLYQTCFYDSSYGDGELVFEYKIKYRLPYCGLAMEAEGERFGVSMNAKYSFSPHAEDYDSHTLRALHFHGDYKSNPNVFMGNFSMFWKFAKNWKANVGVDATLVRINGTVWEESHDPDWDKDQSLDSRQFIYWLGLGYRF